MRGPRILVLSASVGSGHVQAGRAVEAALRLRHPGALVKHVDVLDLAARVFRRVYGEGYFDLASGAPRVLGYLYDALDRPDGSLLLGDSVRRMVQRLSLRTFTRFLEEEPWDAVVNTHFLPAEMIALLRLRGRLDVPQITAVTDFEAHRLWANSPCEHFFVPSEEAAVSLRHWGVPEENVTLSGIPIHPVFSRPADRGLCLKAQGLSGDLPVLLQLCGGRGVGPVEETFRSLLETPVPAQIVAVAGRNEGVRAALAAVPVPDRHRARVLGFTDKIHQLMAAADLLVSKPGGLTTAEALASGLPIIAINPIPGQEDRNCDFLLEYGAGTKVNSLAALPGKAASLLGDPRRLAYMRGRASSLGRPRAAFAVADKAVEIALAARSVPNTVSHQWMPSFQRSLTLRSE